MFYIKKMYINYIDIAARELRQKGKYMDANIPGNIKCMHVQSIDSTHHHCFTSIVASYIHKYTTVSNFIDERCVD